MRYVAIPEVAFTRTIQFISRRAGELQAELAAATDLLDNLAVAKQESDARLTRDMRLKRAGDAASANGNGSPVETTAAE